MKGRRGKGVGSEYLPLGYVDDKVLYSEVYISHFQMIGIQPNWIIHVNSYAEITTLLGLYFDG